MWRKHVELKLEHIIILDAYDFGKWEQSIIRLILRATFIDYSIQVLDPDIIQKFGMPKMLII
jgi:hypothetical protein